MEDRIIERRMNIVLLVLPYHLIVKAGFLISRKILLKRIVISSVSDSVFKEGGECGMVI